MPPASKAGIVNWTWSDWRLKDSVEQQITTLKRHMHEVEKFVFETEDGKQKLKLQDGYLPYLQERLDELNQKSLTLSAGSLQRLGRVSKFKRGAD